MKRIGSLFAGIGGIDLAFEQAGFKTVWANELDTDACATYRKNLPDNFLEEGDIRQIDPAKIPDFDILTAGFPCQPFSVCGKQQGFNDDRGNLFFDICRFIDKKEPKIVFLENVANLVNHDNGNTFTCIYNELASRGYYIRYNVADACNFGIPQHRTRTYIVAFKDLNLCENFLFPESIEKKTTIKDVIDTNKKANDQFYFEPGTGDYERLKEVITDKNQIYRFSDYGIQKSKDGISFTLKANMGTWYKREPIIWDAFGIRKVTPKECLLLQGFPDSFSFPDKIPLKSAYKQAGNTVCVPLVKLIAEKIHIIYGEN